MSEILFSLTHQQIKTLHAAGGRTRLVPREHDSRTLQELKRRRWLDYDGGYSYWNLRKLRLLPKGRAVLVLIRKLALHKLKPRPKPDNAALERRLGGKLASLRK